MATSEKKRSRLEALERKLSSAAGQTPALKEDRPAHVADSSPSSSAVAPQVNQASENLESAERERTYAPLCRHVARGPLSPFSRLNGGKGPSRSVNGILKDILESGKKFQGNVDRIIETRFQDQMIMLDNPSSVQVPLSERQNPSRVRYKRSKEHLSLRKHRQRGSYDLPREFQEFKLYQPLQTMWATYARTFSLTAVVESKDATYVGVRGVMIRETEKTMGIITPENKFRVVPKRSTVFLINIMDLRVTLFGDHLGPPNRTVMSNKTRRKRRKITK